MNYTEFLSSKLKLDVPTGFEPDDLNPALMDFQAAQVRWACRRGRSALLNDCGLGKTLMEHCWADQVVRKTGKPVLIFAPLGVTHQHVREGAKFGIDVRFVTSQDKVFSGVNVTNYQKLHKFDINAFSGIVLDESSILKSFDGQFRKAVTEAAERTPYKLCGTATAAPNDLIEITNHAEFLNVMTGKEIIALFFKQDGNTTHKWRLKGHAERDFWRWCCSWAVNIRKPSDIGFSDSRFVLPPLCMHEHIVRNAEPMGGWLFPVEASTLQERRAARRASMDQRVAIAADLAQSNRNQWVFWCDLNDESEALADAIGATEVAGSTPEDERERIILGFLDGSIRCVVTKPSLWGFGLNLQCCHNTAFVGLSDSYERFYQTIRRFWRFGQDSPVNCHVITSDAEGAVLANIKRKESESAKLINEMVRHMADISSAEIRSQSRQVADYSPATKIQLPKWIAA